MNRRHDVALVVAVAPISPASAADVGEILSEVGHSADVYGSHQQLRRGPERRLSRVFVAHTD